MAVKWLIPPTQQPTPAPIQQQQDIPQETPQAPQEGPGIGRRLSSALAQGVEAPGQFVNKLNMLLGEPSLFQGPLISEKIQEGFTPEQFEPQGVVEAFAQKVAKQAPTSAIFGPAALARGVASAIPATVLGALGAPEWFQDLTQFGVDIGLGVKGGRIFGVKGAQKKVFDAAESLIPKGEAPPAASIIEGLTESGSRLSTKTDKGIVEKVGHIADTVRENFKRMFKGEDVTLTNKMEPRKAMALRRSINVDITKDKNIFEFVKPIQDGINKFFSQYSATNPAFFDALSKGDRLTEARHMKSYIEKGIDLIPGTGGSIGGISKQVLKLVFGKTLGETEKFLRNVITNKDAQKAYLDLGKSILQEDPATIINNISNLTEALETEKVDLPPLRRGRGRASSQVKFSQRAN